MPIRRLPMLVLVLGMVLALAPFVGQHLVNSDELDKLANGWRQVQGQAIYRDFFEFVPPLPQWLAGGLLAAGGPGVWWARAVQALLLVLAGAAQYGVARAAGVRPWLAVLPGLVMATALFPQYPVFYHHWLALAFASGALWCAVRPELGFAAAAGWCVGLAALCTQTDGLLLALALGLGLLGRPRQHLVAALAGFALPLAVTAGILAAQGALGAAVAQVVLWPFQHYRSHGGINDVFYGSDLRGLLALVWQLPFGLPRAYHLAWMYGTWPLLAVALAVRRVPLGEAGRLVALFAAAMMGSCLVGRTDFAHLAMYGSLPLLLAVVWLEHAAPAGGWALAGFGVAGLLLTLQRALLLPGMFAGGVDAYLRDLPVNQYVRAHTGAKDVVAALPAGGLVYLFGASPASPYTLIHPPVMGYNSLEEYKAYWRGVAKARPKLILLFATLDRDATLALYQPPALPGYRYATEIPTPLNDTIYHAYVIERGD